MKILVADDDTPLRKSICLLLTKLGHTSIEARNGSEAMDLLDTILDFDAVITDVQMPGASGIDILQHMHRSDMTPPTYVHSSENTFLFHGNWWELPRDIPMYFGEFASFRKKEAGMLQDITAFTESFVPKKT